MSEISLYRLLLVIISCACICVITSGCKNVNTESPGGIIGRWQVVSNQDINIPNSFFWFTMDYLEFREDGVVWALMLWPPGNSTEIRLNKATEYSFVKENQITIVGSCRHQNPCIGQYSLSFEGDTLNIFSAEGRLVLKRVGKPSKDQPPFAEGPSATVTPLRPR